MSSEEKPYRVYRGGRARGKVPTLPRPERRAKPDGSGPDRPGTRARPKRRRNYRRWFAIALGSPVLLVAVPALGGVLYGGVRTQRRLHPALVPRPGDDAPSNNLLSRISLATPPLRVGRSSVTLSIEVWALRQGQGERVKVTDAVFTFVAVDDNGRPRAIATVA